MKLLVLVNTTCTNFPIPQEFCAILRSIILSFVGKQEKASVEQGKFRDYYCMNELIQVRCKLRIIVCANMSDCGKTSHIHICMCMNLKLHNLDITSCTVKPVCSLHTVAPYNVVIMGDNTHDNGDQLELNCSSEGGPDLVYSWSRINDFSNGTITNTNSLNVSNLATVDGGDYTCTVTNDAATISTTVTVYGELIIVIEICIGEIKGKSVL